MVTFENINKKDNPAEIKRIKPFPRFGYYADFLEVRLYVNKERTSTWGT